MIKKILLAAAISATMALPAFAVEQSTPKVVNVNCDNVSLNVTNDSQDYFRVTAYWTDEAKFPNPPEEMSVGDINGIDNKFSFVCPNLSVTYDGNIFEIKANSIDEIFKKPFFQPSYVKNIKPIFDFHRHSFYMYPSIGAGFSTGGYSINLKDYNLDTGSYFDIKEGEVTTDIDIPKEAVIGYRLNGGDLKPLLFNRKVSTYQEAFKQANTIDIYHKYVNEYLDRESKLERIFIDKPNGTIRFYKKFKFPKS